MYEYEIQHFLSRHGYINVSPKAALIDMDGTLYDSMPNHAKAWLQMVTELGIDDATLDEFFLYEGRTGADTINILFNRAFGRDASPDEARELYRRKTEIFAAMPAVSPMPGAAEMLSFIKSVGMKRVLVTGSGQNTLLNRLDSDYPGAFPPGMRITSRDVTHGKPHPEPFLKAMNIASVTPSECIVIENAPLGVTAGDASGAFTIGVTTGPIPRQSLTDAGAAVVFGSMKECADSLPLLVYALITTFNNVN